jgi:peptidoglycan hydrolase CwlO-like protein
MRKGNLTLVIIAVILLFVALIFSRTSTEGFQTKKEDLCVIVKKGKTDIGAQLDQAKAQVNDANSQLQKIESSLDDVTKLSSSFDC